MRDLSSRRTVTVPTLLPARRGVPLVPLSDAAEGAPASSLLRVRRGVVAAIPGDLDEFERQRQEHLARCVAISRARSSRHAVSRLSAALFHGVATWTVPGRPSITGPGAGTQGRVLDHDRHVLALPESDVQLVDGVPVTSPRRTMLDVARFVDRHEALVALDGLLAMAARVDVRRVRRDLRELARAERETERVRAQLMQAVDRLPERSPGRGRARSILDRAVPWAESPWESHTRWVVLVWGRRDVVAQCRVVTSIGVFHTDLAIPDGERRDGSVRYVHVEFDGGEKYAHLPTRERNRIYARERERQRAIEALGDTVVRVDAREAARPELLVAKIEAALTVTRGRLLRPVRDLA